MTYVTAGTECIHVLEVDGEGIVADRFDAGAVNREEKNGFDRTGGKDTASQLYLVYRLP